MNVVKISLVVAVLGILVGAIAAIIVAWYNSGSRNLALATGTLLASALLFGIQLRFELQQSRKADHLTTAFTVDDSPTTLSIRKWDYSKVSSWRQIVEANASTWLATNNSAAFSKDRDRLFSDFSIFSLVSFLAVEEFDWQLQRVESAPTDLGTTVTSQPVSKDCECTSFDEQALRDKLSRSGNLYSGAHLTVAGGRLCLPPKSALDITAREVKIRNAVCEISWNLDAQPSLTSNVQPKSGGQVVTLPSGKPRYESRISGFKVNVTYFALRSQDRESAKYHEWVSRLLSDAHGWFEGRP